MSSNNSTLPSSKQTQMSKLWPRRWDCPSSLSCVLDSIQTESRPGLAVPGTQGGAGVWRRLSESPHNTSLPTPDIFHVSESMFQSAGLCLSLMSEGTRTTIYTLGQLFSLLNTVLQTVMYYVRRSHGSVWTLVLSLFASLGFWLAHNVAGAEI